MSRKRIVELIISAYRLDRATIADGDVTKIGGGEAHKLGALLWARGRVHRRVLETSEGLTRHDGTLLTTHGIGDCVASLEDGGELGRGGSVDVGGRGGRLDGRGRLQ